MKYISIFCLTLVSITNLSGQSLPDSLERSANFNFSFGMAKVVGKDSFSILQSYNPMYCLKFKKTELGLGFDYYRYSLWLAEEYSLENIYSVSTYVRRYFFKKEYLYAEIFLNTGYWTSHGSLDLYDGNRYISTFGLGTGVLIPPLFCMRKNKYLKNVYGLINFRYSFLHRDILILKSDVNYGLVYKFR